MNTMATVLPARRTWIEVSSSLIRASAPGIEDEKAEASLSAIRHPTFLPSEAIPSQGSPEAITNSSLARDRIPARYAASPRLRSPLSSGAMFSGGANLTTFSAFSVQFTDHRFGEGRGDKSMRDLRVMKLDPDKQTDAAHLGNFGARRSRRRATISSPTISRRARQDSRLR